MFLAKYYPDEGENYMTFWLMQRPPYVARLVTDASQKHLSVSFDLALPERPVPLPNRHGAPKVACFLLANVRGEIIGKC